MSLNFTRTITKATFLSRQVAKNIPFSSNKLVEIFDKFSFKPKSEEAESVKETINLCEAPTLEGKEKYCPTSLESMIDFATSKLGKNVMAMATEVDKEEIQQQYEIVQGIKKMREGDKSVACHAMNYMYAVYYCHSLENTMTYIVPLVGIDGTKAKAVAICHRDTSTWDPNLLAFQVLNVKPGTVPICHFLSVENVVWLAK